MNRRLHTLLPLPPTTFISVPPHPIPTTYPTVFPLSSSPTQFSAWNDSSPFMCQVEFSPLLSILPYTNYLQLLFHSALLGGFPCYYPCCTTGALLQSSHTLSFKKTSVGLKTFCKAHLMGQPEISDLTVNSCSLLVITAGWTANSSIQNKSPKGNILT